ncbi:endonuclease domain-containing protein [Planosporangium sp. 12N6]|uniref:endonuclease domain-containing protein n=1 Tax=Planosporangium spinosum TaxID=3402278 RepID=UPI003CEEECB4
MFRGSLALDEGLLTPSQLRSSAWRRLMRDVYADSRLDVDHGLSCHAAALLMPPAAALAGTSAAWLHGVESAAGRTDRVHVAVPPGTRLGPVLGLAVHAVELPDDDVTSRLGIRCTTATRTAWDTASWFDPVRAVPILDAMLGRGLVTPAELTSWVREREGTRGWRRAAVAFDLADGRAQSPPESVIRVRLVRAGLPRPEPQYPIPLPGALTLHPDLAWPEFRVAVEYDGAYHADPGQLELDRRRLNLLVGAGWVVLHATRKHLGRDFAQLVREVTAALRSAGWDGRP